MNPRHIPLVSLCILLLAACDSGPEELPLTPIVENPIPGIRGEIDLSQDAAEVGETFEVVFYLRNRGGESLVADLSVASPDPETPWQDFRFDTRHIENRSVYLDLAGAGPAPRSGAIEIGPGDRLEFARAEFVASTPGRYLITAQIDWTGIDIIEFEDAPILVLGTHEDPDDPGSGVLDPQIEDQIARLDSSRPPVADRARMALFDLGDAAIPALLEHLGDPNDAIQNQCLEILLGMGSTVLPHAERHLKDLSTSGTSRGRCAFLLSRLAGADAAPTIARLAREDPAVETRRIALGLLSEGRGMPQEAALPVFIDALLDPESTVRRDAIRYLRNATDRGFGYVAEDTEEARQAAQQRWKEWWQARSAQER